MGLRSVFQQVKTTALAASSTATARILARKSAGAGIWEESTISDILDFVGSTAQGDVIYRGATTWTRLAAGTSGMFLKTLGAGANPEWATATAAASISQTEIDFGTAGVTSASFTVTDAAITSSMRVVAVAAYVAATGRDLDEVDMDLPQCAAGAGTGQFTLYATSVDGSLLHGLYKINYTYGA